MHRIRELQSLAIHRRIVERLVAEPDAVIGKARENVRRWLVDSKDGAISAYGEWQGILLEKSPAQIAEILLSSDPYSDRLRQSSPFAGVLDAREVWKIKKNHEAA